MSDTNNLPEITLRTSPQLSIGDAEELATWFLHKMGTELRARLMAERPVLYARVYPSVNPDAIMRNVTAGLARVQQSQAEAFAAAADRHLLRQRPGHYHDPAGTYDYCTDKACPRLKPPAS
jgi:hypothetical protein